MEARAQKAKRERLTSEIPRHDAMACVACRICPLEGKFEAEAENEQHGSEQINRKFLVDFVDARHERATKKSNLGGNGPKADPWMKNFANRQPCLVY